jgi:hypothetical protein
MENGLFVDYLPVKNGGFFRSYFFRLSEEGGPQQSSLVDKPVANK